MTRRVALVWAGLLALAVCQAAEPQAEVARYAGCYVSGEEQSEFRPRGTNELWWLSGELGPALARAGIAAAGMHGLTRSAYLVVDGRLSPEGAWGHMGQYVRHLAVLTVVQARMPQPDDGCLP